MTAITKTVATYLGLEAVLVPDPKEPGSLISYGVRKPKQTDGGASDGSQPQVQSSSLNN